MKGKRHEKEESAEAGEVNKELEKFQKDAEEHKEALMRLKAEFENFEKRVMKEKEEYRKVVNAKLLEEFLPLIDTLEEAIKEAEKNGEERLKKEHEMVMKQLMGILEKNGLERIKCKGEKFDFNLHECVMTANEEGEDNKILEEFQRGYLLNGKVLRPAKVKVNKKN